MSHHVYDTLAALNITLPAVATPAATYVPFVQSGRQIFLSGHIAKNNGVPWVGQLGVNLDTSTGQAAARAVAIDLIGTLDAACRAAGTDLNAVRMVKLIGLVNSSGSYTEQHLVINGCSDLIGAVFGARGAHARSAFGVAQLPLGVCVVIELMAELV